MDTVSVLVTHFARTTKDDDAACCAVRLKTELVECGVVLLHLLGIRLDFRHEAQKVYGYARKIKTTNIKLSSFCEHWVNILQVVFPDCEATASDLSHDAVSSIPPALQFYSPHILRTCSWACTFRVPCPRLNAPFDPFIYSSSTSLLRQKENASQKGREGREDLAGASGEQFEEWNRMYGPRPSYAS